MFYNISPSKSMGHCYGCCGLLWASAMGLWPLFWVLWATMDHYYGTMGCFGPLIWVLWVTVAHCYGWCGQLLWALLATMVHCYGHYRPQKKLSAVYYNGQWLWDVLGYCYGYYWLLCSCAAVGTMSQYGPLWATAVGAICHCYGLLLWALWSLLWLLWATVSLQPPLHTKHDWSHPLSPFQMLNSKQS